MRKKTTTETVLRGGATGAPKETTRPVERLRRGRGDLRGLPTDAIEDKYIATHAGVRRASPGEARTCAERQRQVDALFSIGQQVTLQSGGFRMTVVEIDGSDIVVCYAGLVEICRQWFDHRCLRPVALGDLDTPF